MRVGSAPRRVASRIGAAALALVCALALSGCGLQFSLGFGTETDGRFDGTEIEVPVLFAAGAKGGVTTQRITAASADGGELRIDITENDVSGVDPVTQSATWTAVTAATLLTGARPDTAYTFGFDARIATPAAGAVTAVGVLALYYGTEIQPGVALTGAVTPFGAIRPVAGLAAQVTAAIEAGGIDTILVPAGQRLVRDAEGNTVDLDQLAATGGMTVSEVADIASAYAVMTGEDLPEATFPTPPPSSSPLSTVDADAGDEVAAGDPLADAVGDVTARVVAALDASADPALAEAARASLARAFDLREAGDLAGAFAAASAAADETALAVAPATPVDEAASLAVRTRDDARTLLADLAGRTPATLDEADAVLRAGAAAAEAFALAVYADGALGSEAVEGDAGRDPDAIRAGTTAALLAASTLQTARTVAEVPGGDAAGPIAADADLDGVASLLRRAGIAASTAFDARVIARRAEADGVPSEVAAARLAAADTATLRALALDAARDELTALAPDDEGWAALGISVAGYTRISLALAATQAVRPPADVDTTAAAALRIAVGDEYTVRAVEVLTATGAGVPFVRGSLTQATASATADPAAVSGASAYAVPFVTARVLAFVAGVERS